MRLQERLRFARRSAMAATLTAGYLARFELAAGLEGAEHRVAMLHHWVPRWSSALLEVFGVEVQARGLFVEHGNPYPAHDPFGVGRLFVMNHRSMMDILVLFALTEGQLVSRHDLARWPFVGMGARRIGTMFVDRASLRSGATVLKEMTRALEAGRGVAIFPEGTSFEGDEVRRFHPGAFKAAIRAGAEIVPMGIAYDQSAAYYGDESFGAHLERIASLPRLGLALEVGEVIAPQGRSLVELRDVTHEAVQGLVTRARSRIGPAR